MGSTYVKSTAPGMTWSVDAIKSKGLVTGSAIEGEFKDGVFTFDVFGSRKVYVTTTAKRATTKANEMARQAVLAKLRAEGLSVATEGTT